MPLKFMGRYNPFFALTAAVALGAATAPPDDTCLQAVENAASLNTTEIAAGYRECERSGRDEERAFLLLLGKTRATADFAVLKPSESVNLLEDASVRAVFLFANQDMDPEFSRDAAGFDRVVRQIRETSFVGPPEYAPGWDVSASARPQHYDRFVTGIRESILEMEIYLAGLLRDDRYYSAYVERMEILGNVREGDQLDPRYDELTEVMLRVVGELGEPPTSSPQVPWRLLYEPGPQSGFVQLYTGPNGPTDSSTDLFFSEQDVRASWLAEAIEPLQLDAIMRNVDFEREVLISHNIGTRQNATAHAYITEFTWDDTFDGYSVDSRVGVLGENCGQAPVESHPFLLAKTQRIREGRVNSTSMANYPDECAPVLQGTATPRPNSSE